MILLRNEKQERINRNIQDDAIAILSKYGRVITGTPLGDFSVVPLKANLGWAVTGNHPDIVNFIAGDEMEQKSDDVKIGLLGRERKESDAKELKIVHTEQETPPPAKIIFSNL